MLRGIITSIKKAFREIKNFGCTDWQGDYQTATRPRKWVPIMTCHKCNTQLSAGAKFCPNCVEPVPAIVTPAAQLLIFFQHTAERIRHFTGREWVSTLYMLSICQANR